MLSDKIFACACVVLEKALIKPRLFFETVDIAAFAAYNKNGRTGDKHTPYLHQPFRPKPFAERHAERIMKIYQSVEELIGKTPLLRLNRLEKACKLNAVLLV
jgi:hypothetical protein